MFNTSLFNELTFNSSGQTTPPQADIEILAVPGLATATALIPVVNVVTIVSPPPGIATIDFLAPVVLVIGLPRYKFKANRR